MSRMRRCLTITVLVIVGTLIAGPALAAVNIDRAEVSGSRLRLEGTAVPSRDITVEGVVIGRSDGSGAFRIERDLFTAPADCTVDVNDGSATVTVARLTGCTVTTSPPAGDTTAPTAPAGLTATLSGTTAVLRWTASTDNVGVTGYRVSRGGALLGTVTGTTFSDPGLSAGGHTYAVRAIDAAGNVSAASSSASVTVPAPTATDTTAPTTPGNVSAVLSGTTAHVSWSASADDTGVAHYRLSRNGVFDVIDLLNPFYDDTNLPVGTRTYTVVAVDAAGNVSPPSAPVSVTVAAPPAVDTSAPTVPTSLTTTVVGSTVGLNWGISSDDTGVAGYRITRNGIALAATDATSYSDTGLAAGSYTYAVAAFDAAGNTSAYSTGISATVEAPQGLIFLTPPQLPDATVGQAYLGYIVSSDPPGPSTFTFRLVSGRVPDGTRFIRNTLDNRPEARVVGTPTSAGTFSFTVEVKDNAGATARRTFSIRVLAR